MEEVIVKCTKISITGWKEKDNWKLGTMKIQGEGLNILYFTKEVEKVNKEWLCHNKWLILTRNSV